jgi:CheY-like chemotaxis protein
MTNIRILIVEDDDAQLETWSRQLLRFNARNKTDFTIDKAKTLSEAASLIAARKYDAAVIDIRLKRDGGVKDATHDGNEVRRQLLDTELAVIAHVTGEPNASDMTEEARIVKMFVKGGDDDQEHPIQYEILTWIEEQTPMIEAIRGSKDLIKSRLAQVFCRSIWPRWENWALEDAEGFLSLSLARHLSSHLHSDLLYGSEGKVHPEEWYFLPPTRPEFQTGDITSDGESQFVLVSPRCDLERLNEGDTLLFAKMQDVSKDWASDLKALNERATDVNQQISVAYESGNDEKAEKLRKKLAADESTFRQKYSGHSRNKSSFHFLPKINNSDGKGLGPFFVDFSHIMPVVYNSEKYHELKSSRIASLSPVFLPSLVQRLGAYISRIGSPDYSHIH